MIVRGTGQLAEGGFMACYRTARIQRFTDMVIEKKGETHVDRAWFFYISLASVVQRHSKILGVVSGA